MSTRYRNAWHVSADWRDMFHAKMSVECSRCGGEAALRFARIPFLDTDKDDIVAMSRAFGIAWSIERSSHPSCGGSVSVLVRTPDLHPKSPKGRCEGECLTTCAECGLRRVTTTFDHPRWAWFRCWIQRRCLWAANREHLVAIREYLVPGTGRRRPFPRVAGPVHKLHGDIMRHRAEAVKRIDRMLAPGWKPGRAARAPA